MTNLILPASELRREAVECGIRVRDQVNGCLGRNRLELSSVSVTGERECVISWDDKDGPRDCALKCIWNSCESSSAWENALIDLILYGVCDLPDDEVVDE